MGHVAEDGEDDKAGQEAGEAIDGARDDGVPVAVVVELVVGGEGEEGPEPGAEGEEDLRGSVNPYLFGTEVDQGSDLSTEIQRV